jgi:hypothetical protein
MDEVAEVPTGAPTMETTAEAPTMEFATEAPVATSAPTAEPTAKVGGWSDALRACGDGVAASDLLGDQVPESQFGRTLSARLCSKDVAARSTFGVPCKSLTHVQCIASSVAQSVQPGAPAPEGYENSHTYVVRDDDKNETWTSSSCYFKLHSGLDLSGSNRLECATESPQHGDVLLSAMSRCDAREDCKAVGVYSVPNMPPMQICLLSDVSGFVATSSAREAYSGKVLIKADCGQRFFGYVDQAPRGGVLSSFALSSRVSLAQCVSMCDALGEACSGYQLLASGNCGALLGVAGSEPASGEGHKLFAKASSACQATGSCAIGPPAPPASASSGSAAVVASVVCAIALAVVGALALRRRRLARRLDGSSDESIVSAGPASERVSLEELPKPNTAREAERKHQELMEAVEARLRK